MDSLRRQGSRNLGKARNDSPQRGLDVCKKVTAMAKLYFYYSTMNAGKSTALLQAAYNYAERGMQTLLFSANRDFQERGVVSSRIGIHSQAHLFDSDTDFWEMCQSRTPHCVLIDEAQFLSKPQVRQLTRIVDESNIPVMCYGLRTDFQGELFPGSAVLLAWADTLTEIKTICACGRKATMVVRVMPDGRVEREGVQVELGGNERYVSYCRKHFWESMLLGRCYDLPAPALVTCP
ncbi:thymidine kinase [soil metagenome]